QSLPGLLARRRPVEGQEVQPRHPAAFVARLTQQALGRALGLLLEEWGIHEVQRLRRDRRHGTGAGDLVGVWEIENAQNLQLAARRGAEERQINGAAVLHPGRDGLARMGGRVGTAAQAADIAGDVEPETRSAATAFELAAYRQDGVADGLRLVPPP